MPLAGLLTELSLALVGCFGDVFVDPSDADGCAGSIGGSPPGPGSTPSRCRRHRHSSDDDDSSGWTIPAPSDCKVYVSALLPVSAADK